ncbi:translation initiation factor [Prochlorococcus sp. MIT 1341]|uniref:translation initiation factor n=1 Tax=Prochlorococcus sp. MIT 1341 TaxID=3096221 RepID=UPI002A749C2D|nr:translation initiation factor [Prochlorococcus sp. MIT 1341]
MPKGNWVEFNDPTPTHQQEPNASTKTKAKKEIRIKRVRNNKGGKTITVISGLDLTHKEYLKLLKQFKTRLGTGGTVKGNSIEIQGDQIKAVMDLLRMEGYRPKQSGS